MTKKIEINIKRVMILIIYILAVWLLLDVIGWKGIAGLYLLLMANNGERELIRGKL